MTGELVVVAKLIFAVLFGAHVAGLDKELYNPQAIVALIALIAIGAAFGGLLALVDKIGKRLAARREALKQ